MLEGRYRESTHPTPRGRGLGQGDGRRAVVITKSSPPPIFSLALFPSVSYLKGWSTLYFSGFSSFLGICHQRLFGLIKEKCRICEGLIFSGCF